MKPKVVANKKPLFSDSSDEEKSEANPEVTKNSPTEPENQSSQEVKVLEESKKDHGEEKKSENTKV